MRKNHLKFDVGETATWKSQAMGSVTRKTGTVVAIVKAGITPWQQEGLYNKDDYTVMFDGWARGHESYLISTPGKSKNSKLRLYWPRVVSLSKE